MWRGSAVGIRGGHCADAVSRRFGYLDLYDEGRFPPGTVLAGRYRIVGLIGQGGMGEVYRANDLKLGQPVALKFLPADTAKTNNCWPVSIPKYASRDKYRIPMSAAFTISAK